MFSAIIRLLTNAVVFLFLFTLPALSFAAAAGAPAGDSVQRNIDISGYPARFNLPAIGYAVVKNGEVVAIDATGTRKFGEVIPVTINDLFHLGSDTKAMTAVLAGIYVEAGKLRWN
ncbi:MAG: serine hydrolase [Oligoflexia bacterium]|nr:serine hydrolase [Oligoflexia bacterium]